MCAECHEAVRLGDTSHMGAGKLVLVGQLLTSAVFLRTKTMCSPSHDSLNLKSRCHCCYISPFLLDEIRDGLYRTTNRHNEWQVDHDGQIAGGC